MSRNNKINLAGKKKEGFKLIQINHKHGSNHMVNKSQTKNFSVETAGDLTPIELLEASLALCVLITLLRLLERDGYGELNLQIMANGKKAGDVPSRVEFFQVDAQLPQELDKEYRKKLIVSAERACTIGNTLRQGVEIHTNLSTKEER